MKLSEKNYDEATEWLARLRASDVSNTDHENFAMWLMQDSAHKPAFDAMLQIWEDLGVVSHIELADFQKRNFDAESTVFALKPERISLKRYSTPLAFAATLVFALAALFLVQNTQLEYSTEAGQIELVTLEDGSEVELNGNTRLYVNFSREKRLLRLDHGEAFFKVKKDANRLFIVKNKENTIRAIGTAFGVWDTGDETRVTVTEGRVKVSNTMQSIDLNANQQARMPKTHGKNISSADVDALALTAWREGRLEYEGVALADVISDMNRYMPRKVVIAGNDKELLTHRISGVFKICNQETMLLALQKSMVIPVKIQISSDNQIVIRRIH